MIRFNRSWGAGSWVVIGVLAIAPLNRGVYGQSPQYTPDGKKLLLPSGFEKWVFVGANVGLGYAKDAEGVTPRELKRNTPATTKKGGKESNPGVFHNIYLTPDAYEQYTNEDTFPEGTMLVMDVYESAQKEPQEIVDRGFYEAGRKEIEVAVKNSQRPDRTDTSKGNWAYYAFSQDDQGQLAKSASAFDDNMCFKCHKKHADDDHVWVQFYPVIRKK